MNGNGILLILGVVVFVVCVAGSEAAAYDIVEFPICTDSNSQHGPAVSGNIVVWEDDRNGNDDVYGYDLLNNNEFPICTDANKQEWPAISGNIVVWRDERSGNYDIYGYDLLNPGEFPICTAIDDQTGVDISGSIVVWEDQRSGNYDIYGYNLLFDQNELAICTDTNDQYEPVVSGSIVVWDDWRKGNGDIYGYDLLNPGEFLICEDSNNQSYPAIGGNIVVWRDDRRGNSDIYGYDLLNNSEFPICTDANTQRGPVVSGNIVVWEDNRNGNYDIYGYDLLNNREFPICVATNNQYKPRVSGNLVVWYDYRNGNRDIYGAYILPPAHDKCENAVAVEVNVPYYGSTVGSTGTDVSGCAGGDTQDVWHTLTPVDGNYTVSLCGSDFDTSVAVYDGCPLDANELACNDNNDVCGSGSGQSQLDVSLNAGKTYYIRVSGTANAMGNYVLKVTGPKCTTAIAGDVNNDCKVNFKDVAVLALDWLDCYIDPQALCSP